MTCLCHCNVPPLKTNNTEDMYIIIIIIKRDQFIMISIISGNNSGFKAKAKALISPTVSNFLYIFIIHQQAIFKGSRRVLEP